MIRDGEGTGQSVLKDKILHIVTVNVELIPDNDFI